MVNRLPLEQKTLGSSPSSAAIRLTTFTHGYGPKKGVECPERSRGINSMSYYVYIGALYKDSPLKAV